MKANEMRIGNIVGRGFMNPTPAGLQKWFEPCEVKSLGIERVITNSKIDSNELIKHPYGNLKPIPLTEEWLLKFGFLKFHKSYALRVVEVFINENGGIQIFPFDAVRKCINHINSVHQLQNLYFALTGEELTIKN